MYLLDTNVLSEARKQRRGNANVLRWFEQTDAELMYISPIVVAEIEMGVRSIERRDAAQGQLLRSWLEKINTEFSDRCVAIDREVARIFARLQVPDRKPERDCWIAAIALREGMTIVTRNEADFRAMDVPHINPWLEPNS